MRMNRCAMVGICLALLGATACGGWYTRYGIKDEKELHSFRSVHKLIKALEVGNCYDAMRASQVLHEIGGQARSAFYALEKTMKRTDCNIRQRMPAAMALGRLDEVSFPILQKGLTGTDPDLRTLAVLGFGEMRYNQRVVVGLLNQKIVSTDPLDEGARGEAFRALGRHGQAAIQAIPDLVSLLKDEQWRWSAMDALVDIGHPSRKALDALKALADSNPDPEFKAWVMERHDKLMAKASKRAPAKGSAPAKPPAKSE